MTDSRDKEPGIVVETSLGYRAVVDIPDDPILPNEESAENDDIDEYDLAIAKAMGFVDFNEKSLVECPFAKGTPMRKMYKKGFRKAERMLIEMGRKAFRDGKGMKRDTQCSSDNAQDAFRKGWKMELEMGNGHTQQEKSRFQ